MGDEETSFGAIVVAGVTMLIGTKVLVNAMIALLSVRGGTVQLMLDSVVVTTVVGIILLMTTGALVARMGWSRPLAIVALAVVAVLGRPTMGELDPIAVVQTTITIVTILYLLAYNPVSTKSRSDIDESSSATRIGSTIR